MAEVRLKIDDAFLNAVSGSTGNYDTASLTNEAYTFLKWAADEIKKGRVIITANSDGSDAKKIVIPELERVRPKP